MRVSTDAGVWISVFCTLGLYSILWKDNKWYSTVENAFVGVAAAHALVLSWVNIRDVGISGLRNGDMYSFIPMLLGILVYSKFATNRNVAWLHRIPTGFLYGLGAGMTVRATIISQVLTQLRATIVKVASINDVVMIFGVLATLAYFVFSWKPSPAQNVSQRLGRWIIMISLGVSFGSSVMGRLSSLLERLKLIYGDWLGIIH